MVHILENLDRDHLPARNCWCGPELIFDNELGEVWVHDNADGRLPTAHDVAEAIALLYHFAS